MSEAASPRGEAASALRQVASWPIVKRSLAVAAVVGTVLNAINQGDVLLAGGAVDWLKAGLTYLVPFCVASYGAWCACRLGARRRGD